MKNIYIIMIIALFSVESCKKETITPVNKTNTINSSVDYTGIYRDSTFEFCSTDSTIISKVGVQYYIKGIDYVNSHTILPINIIDSTFTMDTYYVYNSQSFRITASGQILNKVIYLTVTNYKYQNSSIGGFIEYRKYYKL